MATKARSVVGFAAVADGALPPALDGRGRPSASLLSYAASRLGAHGCAPSFVATKKIGVPPPFAASRLGAHGSGAGQSRRRYKLNVRSANPPHATSESPVARITLILSRMATQALGKFPLGTSIHLANYQADKHHQPPRPPVPACQPPPAAWPLPRACPRPIQCHPLGRPPSTGSARSARPFAPPAAHALRTTFGHQARGWSHKTPAIVPTNSPSARNHRR